MFKDLDTEQRTRIATGALEALTQLIESQRPGEAMEVDSIAPLLRTVTEVVKWAMPAERSVPRGCND